MDFSKLSTAQRIALGGGVVLLICLFVPWYGISVLGISATANAFDAGFLAWFGALLGIAAAVLIGLKALQSRSVSAGGLQTEQIALVLGAVGTLLMLVKLLVDSDFTRFGIYLSILAGAVVTYGSFQAMREAGLAMPSGDDFKKMVDRDGPDDQGS
jgi:hypothetical protein